MGTSRIRPAPKCQHTEAICLGMHLPYFVRLGLVAFPHEMTSEARKMMLRVKEIQLSVFREEYLFLERILRMYC